jgi:starch-binding outer membrane protein SusE/F
MLKRDLDMKKFIHHVLFFAGAASMLLTSCKKDYAKVYFDGGSAPVLTATATDSIPLPLSDTTGTAVTFNWTNPNYQYSDGISSMNVAYYLEIDTVSSFSTTLMQQVAISSGLSQTFTVSSLNALLTNQLLLDTSVTHTIFVRLESFITPYTNGSAPIGALYSSTLSFSVTPYALPPAVAPPTSGKLYITGSATGDSWMVAGNVASVAGQQFTQVNATLYTITLPLIGGQQFLVVPVAGDWTNKYATASTTSATTGGGFLLNAANNFNGPTASGTYTVTFNFQTGNYTITQ